MDLGHLQWWNVLFFCIYIEAYPCLGSDQRLVSIEEKLIHITTHFTNPTETFIVPYQKNDQFTGRRAFLAELSTKLWAEDSEKSSHRVILHGLGGVGKTQIALQYAHTHRDIYGSVFWVSGVNDATLLTGFQDIAKRSGCINDIGTLEPTEIAIRVLSWLNAQNRWLLVIDNLDDDCVIEKYLPYSSPFKHTIITTRNEHCDIPAEKLEVGILDLDDSRDLLLTRSKIAATTDVHNEATKIVSLLGYLPLAIEQAAAYIREISKNIFNFIKRYSTARILFDKKPQKGIRYYSESVATTWRLSFEKCNSDASNLLRLLAFLNPDGILIEFLEAGISGVDEQLQQILPDSERFDLALSELERFSLIKRQGDGKNSKIVIHRLVQAVIKDEMPSEVFSDMTEAIMKLCDSAFPHWNTSATMDNETRLQCRKFQNQILTPLSDIPSIDSVVVGNLSCRVGIFLSQDGKYRESEELLTKAISVFEEVVGSDHRDTFRAKSELGWMFADQGLSAEAISLLEPLLKVATRLLGDEDLDVLEMKRRLAWAYHTQNRMEDAVKLGEEVLEARTRLLGEEHPDTLRIMSNLASMYNIQGNWGDAVKLGEKVLEARTRLLGKEHPDTLTTMSNLAATYSDQGNWEDAGKLGEKVLEARTRLLGKEHPDTLTTMSNLAVMYSDQGNWEDAGKLGEKVLEARTRLLGKEHPDTLTTMSNLAATYNDQGNWEDAGKLGEKVLEARTRLLGKEHPDTLTTMSNLANTYSDQGNREEAGKLREKVLEARTRLLGKEHPDTLTAMSNLAITYSDQGNWEEAGKLGEKVLEARTRLLGKEHPDTLSAMTNLAITCGDQGNWEEAGKLEEKVLEARTRLLGKEHPDTLTTMSNLAITYSYLGKWEEADKLKRRYLRQERDCWGNNILIH